MEKIEHIDKLLFPIGNGATGPIQGIIKGTDYVIKTFNNIQGNKTLVNELVCYLIAKELEFPIPNAKLGILDSDTQINKEVLEFEDFNPDCQGICFCSEFLRPVSIVNTSKLIQASNNYRWLLPKLMLFDHLIYNKDRNMGNILISLQKSNKLLYIIDHSHTFNLESIWNSTGLYEKISSKDYLDDYIMKNNSYHYSNFKKAMTIDAISIQESIDYFKEKLSINFFEHVIDNIPEMWENEKSELKALSDYLIYRMEHLCDFGNIITSTTY
ncbi:MAG: HipA family kinase [Clostridium butyricum]